MYFVFGYAITALSAEHFAREGLALLLENRVVSQYCNRDYEDQVAEFGEVVNVHKILESTARRLPENTALTYTARNATGLTVTMDQHVYDAFTVTDRDAQRSFKDLVSTFLAPTIRAIATKIDLIVQGEKYQTYKNQAGRLGTDVSYNTLVDLSTVQNNNNVPLDGRALVINPNMGGALLKEDKLTLASTTGDGTPLISGLLGHGAGYSQIAQSTSLPNVAQTDKYTGAINHAAGYGVGDTSLVIDGISSYAGVAGQWVTIAGKVYRAASVSDTAGDMTGMVLESPGLLEAVADDAVVVVYDPILVDEASGYDAGHLSTITYDGETIHPQVGQGVTFGTTGDPYGIIAVDTTAQTIELNRSLDAAVADDAPIFLMPGGNYGLAMNPNAITIVNRPLALPQVDGINAAIVAYEGFALRVLITYDRDYLRHKVSIDTLLGVLTLDEAWNALLLG